VSLSPMQWTAGTNAGFSDSDHQLLIPLNPDYETNNFDVLYNSEINSPLRLFKRMANLRQTDDFVYGNVELGNQTGMVLTLTIRNTGGFTFVGAMNFDQDWGADKNATVVNLVSSLADIKDSGTVVAQTSNLARRGLYQARQAQDLKTLELRPLEGIVLKFKSIDCPEGEELGAERCTGCEPTCDKEETPICTERGCRSCQCKPGLKRSPLGICLLADHCPGKSCGDGRVRNDEGQCAAPV